MMRTNGTGLLLAGLILVATAFTAASQDLPVVAVTFTVEGDHYVERSPLIDTDSLGAAMTGHAVELLGGVDGFGFLDFRSSHRLADSVARPELLIRFVEEAVSDVEHRHTLIYEFRQVGMAAEELDRRTVFGSTDDHLFYDQTRLETTLVDRLEDRILNDAFEDEAMRQAFRSIPLARTLEPDADRFVHMPIAQSKLLAARGSRFSVEVSSPNVSKTSFLKVSVAFSTSGSPNPQRTTCATDSLWFPSSTFIDDIDSKWDDVVDLLAGDDSVRVSIWTERFVPDRTPSNVSGGVIMPGE